MMGKKTGYLGEIPGIRFLRDIMPRTLRLCADLEAKGQPSYRSAWIGCFLAALFAG